MTTPLKSVDYVKSGEYAVRTACGYRLRVKRDDYAGGWRIWNVEPGSPEWGSKPYPTKRKAIAAVREAFSK